MEEDASASAVPATRSQEASGKAPQKVSRTAVAKAPRSPAETSRSPKERYVSWSHIFCSTTRLPSTDGREVTTVRSTCTECASVNA